MAAFDTARHSESAIAPLEVGSPYFDLVSLTVVVLPQRTSTRVD